MGSRLLSIECEIGQENLEQCQESVANNLYFEVMVCEFSHEIKAGLGLLAILEVLKCIHSWVHHVEPKWWNHAQHEAVKVLEWVIRGIVKSTKDLIWSEGVGVMVRVSLDSEKDWG